jgi:hypothetical protein
MKAATAQGVVGIFATGTGVVMSKVELLTAWGQLISVWVGALVGLAMFVSIVQKIRRNRRKGP